MSEWLKGWALIVGVVAYIFGVVGLAAWAASSFGEGAGWAISVGGPVLTFFAVGTVVIWRNERRG